MPYAESRIQTSVFVRSSKYETCSSVGMGTQPGLHVMSSTLVAGMPVISPMVFARVDLPDPVTP